MERINKLFNSIKDRDIDGILVSSVPNVTYLSHFTGDSSILVLSPDRYLLLTDGRYTEQARQECPGGIEIMKWLNNKRFGIETYQYVVNELNIKRLGFEGQVMSFSSYESLKKGLVNTELVNLEGCIEKLRRVKDMDEIGFLKAACEISVRALEVTLPLIKEGITERELAAKLDYNLRDQGADAISFDTIVLTGARTSLLHGKPEDHIIKQGDLVLFDFGALYKGYHADISRVFIIGKPGGQQKELYEIIQEAQMAGVLSVMPDVSGRRPDEIVRKHIPDQYIPYYYPGLGHGVGLQIHEEPFIGQASETMLEKDMVLTVEPGVYIPEWGGIRIEDTVWIREESAEILTGFTRELMVL
ncbi:MAG: aminopeptidase P family protein [Bacteroidales bacterium]|nr:aminopeptidase P family protein [Bacteroidales bacterium]